MTTDSDLHAWADTARDERTGALSITVVEPARADLIAILDPREPLGMLTIEQALDRSLAIDDFAWGSVVVQTDELDGWSVLIEPNGWVASFPKTLERLSVGGRAANVFWNVNAVMSFGWAVDGVVVRQFDPLLYDPEGALPDEADLPFGHPGSPRAAALALLQRLTGVAVQQAWLVGRARPSFVVPLASWGD